jgi:hypothetical protein
MEIILEDQYLKATNSLWIGCLNWGYSVNKKT